jgi:S-adenosylmethionine:tRNA ribosyltransferase-isomerase
MKTLDFILPAGLEATEPPPARDDVRLLVASASGVEHARFSRLGEFLAPGDLVVVNTSATLAAAVDGNRAGVPVEVHFSAELDDGTWVVEVRVVRVGAAGTSTGPVTNLRPCEVITLDAAAGAALIVGSPRPAGQTRLWEARPRIDGGVSAFLARHGRPIRYAYVPRQWPLAEYQTVFAREPGSAEMPSAGRPFTEHVVTDLVTRGLTLAPIVLHTGVSSQEPGEPPQPERFRVPGTTARLVNSTRQAGGRVIAVGTTVTRALESAADQDGSVRGRHGWTDLVLGPARPARVVTGLVTGWHAPGASHLALLAAVAGDELVERAYAEAVRHGYQWHEFGDSCLLLPLRTRGRRPPCTTSSGYYFIAASTAVTAASIATRAVTALTCARSSSPRLMQSNATRASWMAASSSRAASCSTGPRSASSVTVMASSLGVGSVDEAPTRRVHDHVRANVRRPLIPR